jgi:hypothetical protein
MRRCSRRWNRGWYFGSGRLKQQSSDSLPGITWERLVRVPLVRRGGLKIVHPRSDPAMSFSIFFWSLVAWRNSVRDAMPVRSPNSRSTSEEERMTSRLILLECIASMLDLAPSTRTVVVPNPRAPETERAALPHEIWELAEYVAGAGAPLLAKRAEITITLIEPPSHLYDEAVPPIANEIDRHTHGKVAAHGGVE